MRTEADSLLCTRQIDQMQFAILNPSLREPRFRLTSILFQSCRDDMTDALRWPEQRARGCEKFFVTRAVIVLFVRRIKAKNAVQIETGMGDVGMMKCVPLKNAWVWHLPKKHVDVPVARRCDDRCTGRDAPAEMCFANSLQTFAHR